MADDVLDEQVLREGSARAQELRRRLDGLPEVQRSERHTARAPRLDVTATVDGAGRVLRLEMSRDGNRLQRPGQAAGQTRRIEDRMLRRGHPELVGAAILQAIGAARTQAAVRARELITSILNGDPDGVPAPQPPEPAQDDGFDLLAGLRGEWGQP
jgi:hypothetical protein